ncbi:MAG: hypothetical protein M1834_005308 [Cirrosporium novae-zelandiae]|nr:MAG: hypothetical protein M1834_005308 [Cirrosporium novae-zelandiae]
MSPLSASSDIDLSHPWQSLAHGLGFPDEHQEYWWAAMAPSLGKLMKWANYPVHQQYRILAFVHQYVLPSCGPQPNQNGEFFWKTSVSFDCTPIQLSLNFYNNKATVRTANIPISELSGTSQDPLNQKAPIDTLYHQKKVFPSQDLRWFKHFTSALFIPNDDDASSVKARADNELFAMQAVQCMLSYDFLGDDTQVKVAMCPLWKHMETGKSNKQLMWEAIQGLGGEVSSYLQSLSVLEEYTDSDRARIAAISPVFFAFDTSLSSKYKSSRIKIYYFTPRTAFNTMVDIFTLGGRLMGLDMDRAVDALRILWHDVVKVPEGHSDDDDLPLNPTPSAGVIFNFEIWPGAKLPVPKMYLPAHYYGRDDLEIADGMDKFFQSQRWIEPLHSYKKNYLSTFMTDDNKLAAVHHDISFSSKNSGLYVTAYYKPELSTVVRTKI